MTTRTRTIDGLRTTVGADAEPTNEPAPKVVAATGGAAVAGAATVLVAYVLRVTVGIELPAEVLAAGVVILTAAGAFAGGWIKRP